MSAKAVIDVQFDEDGITYFAGDACRSLITALTSTYARELEARANWVAANLGDANIDKLTGTFEIEGRRWGAELESASFGGI